MNKLISKHNSSIGKVSSRYHELVIDRGEGIYLFDKDGKRYLDFTSGMAANPLGHTHPKIISSIQTQIKKMIHAGARVGIYEPQIELAEELKKICPGMQKDGQVVYANSGSEAIENALKLARSSTNKPIIISFLGAFHGRTLGATSVTSSKASYRKSSETIVSGTLQLPYPNYSRFTTDQVIDLLRLYFKSTIPISSVAGILIEPVLGEGGYIVPPKDFLPKMRELCNEIGCLLILDEIQTGIGRTGEWLAINHYKNLEADIYCLGKAIGGGFPVSAVVAKKQLMDKWGMGLHVGGTFAGNIVGCAAGIEVIKIIRKDRLVENASAMGEYLKNNLQKALSKFKIFKSIGGIGLMLGIKLKSKDKDIQSFEKEVLDTCAEEGMILTTCGEGTLRILPPLNVTKKDCNEFIKKIVKVFSSYE